MNVYVNNTHVINITHITFSCSIRITTNDMCAELMWDINMTEHVKTKLNFFFPDSDIHLRMCVI